MLKHIPTHAVDRFDSRRGSIRFTPWIDSIHAVDRFDSRRGSIRLGSDAQSSDILTLRSQRLNRRFGVDSSWTTHGVNCGAEVGVIGVIGGSSGWVVR